MTTREVTDEVRETLPDDFFGGHIPDAMRIWEVTETGHPTLLRFVGRFGQDVAVGTYVDLLGIGIMARIDDGCSTHSHPDNGAAEECYSRITGLMDTVTTAEAVGGDPRLAGKAFADAWESEHQPA